MLGLAPSQSWYFSYECSTKHFFVSIDSTSFQGACLDLFPALRSGVSIEAKNPVNSTFSNLTESFVPKVH